MSQGWGTEESVELVEELEVLHSPFVVCKFSFILFNLNLLKG